MADLFAAATTVEALTAAWEDLLADDRADGHLAPGTRRFAADADDRLAELAADLASGHYRPRPLSLVAVPKDDRGRRELSIPAVPDRVVEKAVAGVLNPLVDAVLGPSSYAYRPGLGVADAVQQVCRLRAEGMTWVAHADIDDCFPTVDVTRVRHLLAGLVNDRALLYLIDGLLRRPVTGPGGRRPLRGLAQGSPLSPMLANLALEHVDNEVIAAGFPMIRYGDDVLLLAASQAEAREGLRVVSDAAHDIGMTLGEDTAQVTSFADGFCFLGEDFGPRYPPVRDDHRIREPSGKTLYVGVPGSGVRIANGRLLVETSDDVELLDIPSGHVERIVMFGPVGISAGARTWALASDVEVILASRRGSYLGQVASGSTRRVDRVRALLACADDPARSLAFGRTVVEAKIRKQIVLVRRLTRRGRHEELAAAVAGMRRLVDMLPDATTRDEVLGLEGAAAREYFGALSVLLPEGLRFGGRNRRPPLDVVNAALSFGYTILLGEAVTALAAAGVDPAVGLLHVAADRRPSLALDLIEEFRPLIVDQVVVTAARRGQLRPEHGRTEEGRNGGFLPKVDVRRWWRCTSGGCSTRLAAPCPDLPAACAVICTGRRSGWLVTSSTVSRSPG